MSQFRKHFFITLGIAVFAVSIFFGTFFYLFFGIIAPLSIEFRQVQENIETIEESTKDFRGRISPALTREESDIIKIEKSFFVYSPDTAKEFIIFLETAARRNNLTGEINTLPQANNATASVTVSGNFDDAIIFLREIENGPLLLAIDGISLRAAGDKISLSLQIRLPTPPQNS